MNDILKPIQLMIKTWYNKEVDMLLPLLYF